MFIAENENKERIEPEEVVEGAKYFCPCCGGEVIPKRGEIMTWHFAHRSNKDCDKWYEMTAWHKEWQEQFPKEFREIPMERDGEKHRADIKISDLVIEFQNSGMTYEEFRKRNDFYSKDGILIWLFNATKKNNNQALKNSTEWKRPKVFIFQEDENGILEMDDERKRYTKKEFIQRVRDIYSQARKLKELKDGKYNSFSFFKCNLSTYRFDNYNFNNVTFKEANLINAMFENCTFTNCTFTDCTFVKITFVGKYACKFTNEATKIRNCKFNNCTFINNKQMQGIKIIDTEIKDSKFKYNNMDEALIDIVKIINSEIDKVYARSICLHEVNIEGCSIKNSDFKQANYHKIANLNNEFIRVPFKHEKYGIIDLGIPIEEIKRQREEERKKRELLELKRKKQKEEEEKRRELLEMERQNNLLIEKEKREDKETVLKMYNLDIGVCPWDNEEEVKMCDLFLGAVEDGTVTIFDI